MRHNSDDDSLFLLIFGSLTEAGKIVKLAIG